MSGNGFKLRIGDNISELEKQSEKIEELISFCRAVRFKLMVECLQLKSELRDLQVSDNTGSNKVQENSTNLDSVGTNVRLDLRVPSSSLILDESEEEEEEEMDEEE